jgi:hypothetical protein
MELTLPKSLDVHEMESMDDWEQGVNTTVEHITGQIVREMVSSCPHFKDHNLYGSIVLPRWECSTCMCELKDVIFEASHKRV